MTAWRDAFLPGEIAYSAEEALAMDRWLLGRGFTLEALMAEAGRRVAEAARELARGRVVYLVGPGHNGGDARVAASLLPGELWRPLADDPTPRFDRDTLLVDGLFGVGLSRPVEGAARAAIDAVNASPAMVLAIDVPSGLCATTGAVLGAAIRARYTLAFVGPKQGFFVGDGPAHVGRWAAVEIGFPASEAAAWVRARRG